MIVVLNRPNAVVHRNVEFRVPQRRTSNRVTIVATMVAVTSAVRLRHRRSVRRDRCLRKASESRDPNARRHRPNVLIDRHVLRGRNVRGRNGPLGLRRKPTVVIGQFNHRANA